MYKLIIGNVKVTITDDNISRDQATALAKQAITTAGQHGKLLSHVEIDTGDTGVEINTTEKTGYRSVRKTIKQSLLDGIYAASKEKFFPMGTFCQKDLWFDSDTGQEWRGQECELAREEVLKKLKEWIDSQDVQNHT
ncbi:MAG TPA: hypothetical protein PKA28_12465 [Methylomusa anaerophila]|uniref:Uncharacterized protein n=1 Tax=Methylomusa anaerophila TaxID=1930071 RepID=A0A348AF63_9FIRM|nr:hypothetical protein [Methylomusa anaerophila]BBB89711.1 hypothetical protein MAMMFC1_00344 [Methylomusa anaerophila]HML89244.1 hypothetical protein [Methylomusa anaerophila]